MNQNLLDFSQLILESSLTKKTGLIPIFSTQMSFQKHAFDFIVQYLKETFPGFLIFKNNKFPEDDLKELNFYLKPNTIIIVNNVSNSFQYKEILDLSKNNLMIVGFQCFCSDFNYFHDFISRYELISKIDYETIKQSIIAGLFCFNIDKNNNNNFLDYLICKS